MFQSSSVFVHSASLFIFFCLNELISWPLLKLWNVYGSDSDFIDLRWFWYSANCYKSVGLRIFEPIGEICGGYQYGLLPISVINNLELPELIVFFLGYFLMASYCFLITKYLLPIFSHKRNGLMLYYFLAISPPMMLFVQRGQIDLLVLLLVFIAIRATVREGSSHLSIVFAAFLLYMVSLIKFYPVVFLLSIGLFSKNKWTKFTFLFVFLFTLFPIWNSMKLTPVKINDMYQTTSMQFGFFKVFERVNETSSFELNKLEMWVLSVILHVCFWFVERKLMDLSVSSHEDNQEANLNSIRYQTLIWSAGAISCYFLGSNIDFRLIFLAFSLSCLARLRMIPSSVNISLLSTNFWLSYESGGLEIFGDLSVGVTIAVLIQGCISLMCTRRAREG